jgi:hypothetical protein
MRLEIVRSAISIHGSLREVLSEQSQRGDLLATGNQLVLRLRLEVARIMALVQLT